MKSWVGVALCVLLGVASTAHAQAPNPPADGVTLLLSHLEHAISQGDPLGYAKLLSATADLALAEEFANASIEPGVTRAVVKERDREPLTGARPDEGYRLVVDVFIEFGARARVTTWRLDLRRTARDEWRISAQERLSTVDGLHKLSLSGAKEYAVHDLAVTAEDLELKLPQGSAFVSEADDGVTAMVLLGEGEMIFSPTPPTERGQVRLFAGDEVLRTRFDTAFIRVNPADYTNHVSPDHLDERSVNPRDLKRAEEVFHEELPKSFGLDLSDLSRENWSLLPTWGDFLAEVRTRRFDTLTYAHSSADPEDITLFDRRKRRNISVYSSQQKLAVRGRFYNEDDLTDYDVLDYDVETAFAPDRQWLDGRTRLKIKIRSYAAASLTLRLADPLTVQGVFSDLYGRLLHLRVRNQNSVVVNLPTAVPRDTELNLTVLYGGRLPPQPPERETAVVDQRGSGAPHEERPLVAPEPSYIYSNRIFWYPQSTVSDYATATLRVTVPAEYVCVASGELAVGSPVTLAGAARGATPGRRLYVFTAPQPLRYLACLISRFSRVETATLALQRAEAPAGSASDGFPRPTGVSYESVGVTVEANPRQQGRGRETMERGIDLIQYYSSLMGDCPYPSLTVALVESDLPGEHSPAYLAPLNQPLPPTPFVWRNDPATFSNFPEFFLAHEIAHQWWGQAVGWKNYHEQWLSEGFAQYFAALYAQHRYGDDTFNGILRQLRRWALHTSSQGPVYLGYRLGHVKGDSRVFRALVYNKGAAVLHMLRRLLGDEAFFRGLRRFYTTRRFQKAGTEDLRRSFEAETGRSLERFFERWIYNASLPRLKFSYRAENNEAVLRFEQLTPEIFDVPVTVTLQIADRSTAVVVPVVDKISELRVPLTGTLRGVDVNRDDAAVAEIVK